MATRGVLETPREYWKLQGSNLTLYDRVCITLQFRLLVYNTSMYTASISGISILEYLTVLLEYINLLKIFSGRKEQMFGGACAPL